MTPFASDATPHNGTHLNGTHRNGTGLNGAPQPTPPLFRASSVPSWAEPEPDEVEVERQRLLAEIAEARRLAADARARAAAREAEVQAALHEELVDSRESLAEIERKYEVAINMVREAARLEAERILEDARRQAALYPGASSFRQEGGPNV